VIPAKAADASTTRLLLAIGKQESLTIYTDGFRAYDSLDEDDAFTREYVVHSDGEYVDEDVHVNTCESHIGAPPKTASLRISKHISSAVESSENQGRKH
jgi:transposase-like protein